MEREIFVGNEKKIKPTDIKPNDNHPAYAIGQSASILYPFVAAALTFKFPSISMRHRCRRWNWSLEFESKNSAFKKT